jgi:hypothetical protein
MKLFGMNIEKFYREWWNFDGHLVKGVITIAILGKFESKIIKIQRIEIEFENWKNLYQIEKSSQF